MRKQLVSLAAAASLMLTTVSSISAQLVAPALPLPAPAIQPVLTSSSAPSEPPAVSTLRVLLADRGFYAGVAQGPMAARAPGTATESDFVGDADRQVQLGPMQVEASLVWTLAGGWWVWESGAAAPADERAADLQAHALRFPAHGRYVGD